MGFYIPFTKIGKIIIHFQSVCVCVCMFAQLCPTLCDPMNSSLPGFSVHGISQVRILERVAISFSIPVYTKMPNFFTCLENIVKSLYENPQRSCRTHVKLLFFDKWTWVVIIFWGHNMILYTVSSTNPFFFKLQQIFAIPIMTMSFKTQTPCFECKLVWY